MTAELTLIAELDEWQFKARENHRLLNEALSALAAERAARELAELERGKARNGWKCVTKLATAAEADCAECARLRTKLERVEAEIPNLPRWHRAGLREALRA